ncbi:MAG: HD-GYP domain-containing protein [Planctomycetes bacterium]|nr:HD-GYP domain-containing protein [Planctomycetota bacterium]
MESTATDSGKVILVGPPLTTAQFEDYLSTSAWDCTRFDTPRGVLRQIRGDSTIDLVILIPDDVIDPYINLCRDIKFDRRTAFICVIFVMPAEYAEGYLDVYQAGVNECIRLPASREEILLRLLNALRAKRATDSLEDATAVITSLAAAIEGRDAYTHGHVERVAVYSVEIGKRMGVVAAELDTLKFGAIVHDLGKIAIPDSILNKPGKLDDLEMELIKRHPVIGYDILRPSRTFHEVLPIVRWHHERPNGTGYPDRLEGDDLPLHPRIVAVADVFDALATARPYRPALPPSKCEEILVQSGEKGELDARLVEVLLDTVRLSADIMADSPAAPLIGAPGLA